MLHCFDSVLADVINLNFFLIFSIQSEEGMHQAAARNYHTATVYFRVLESMVPRLTSRVHASLNYAACRTQQSSHLLENLVHEHFEGLRCDISTSPPPPNPNPNRIRRALYHVLVSKLYSCRLVKEGELSMDR